MSKENQTNERAVPQRTYDLPEVLTVGEVAKFLRIDRKTLYDEIKRGGFPIARRVGRRTVILRDAMVAWLWSKERVLPRKRRR